MAWTPSNTQLYVVDQLNEFVNFAKTITYEDTGNSGGGGGSENQQETYTVSIVAQEVNQTVSTIGNTISGYYSNSFDGYSITYLTKDGSYKSVVEWSKITNAKEIVDYHPAMQQTKTFTYTATATGDVTNTKITQDYTIVVTNDWTVGKNNLKAAIAETRISR